MKIIVTGGAGFLGSHLCDQLIAAGNEVICVDNLITGSLKNIEHLKINPQFKFIEKDVVEKLPQDLSADQIYHLASPASPHPESFKSYHKLSFETMLVNTIGTWNLAEFAAKMGAKFLFASTSEVYGEPLEHPQKEEYRGNVSTTGPRSVYDESKRFGETITAAFARSKSLDSRIVRIFNTYGPRMAHDDGRVVIEFVTACLSNKPLTIFGDGKGTRSFCYVSDLIEGLILAMNKANTKDEIFNLGNDQEFTILELAERIRIMTGSTSEIIFKAAQPDEPTRRRPDIAKAKEVLGWEPKVTLDEGLERLINYLHKNSL